MGDLRANPARDLAFQESIKEGHLWECESFYSGWDAAMAFAEEAVRMEREAVLAAILDTWRVRGSVDELSARRCWENALRARSEQGGEG